MARMRCGMPFGVVNAVNSQPDYLVFQTPLGDQSLHFVGNFGTLGIGFQLVKIHADGYGAHQGGIVLVIDQAVFLVNAGAEDTLGRFHEVVAVVADVEAQHIVAQQAVQQLFLPGTDAEYLVVGPRDMPELPGNHVGVGVAEEARQQGQVVILDEYRRRAAVNLLKHLLGKGLVDRRVSPPIGLVEGGFDVSIVAQGPQAVVGNAVVVSALLFVREPKEPKGVGGIVGRHHDAISVVHRQVVARSAAVGNPSAGALLHQRVNGGGDAPGGDVHPEFAVYQFVDVGLAVGNDDNPVVADFPIDQASQAVSAPDWFSHLLPLQPARPPAVLCY